MSIDVPTLGATLAASLAAFLPFLVKAGSAGGEKLAETIAEKGGEAAWTRARGIWKRLKTRLGDDDEMQAAARVVAAQPEDEGRRALLAEVLTARLQASPELARELLSALGEPERLQEVLADRGSRVEAVEQSASPSAPGVQRVAAGRGSTVKDVRQRVETKD